MLGVQPETARGAGAPRLLLGEGKFLMALRLCGAKLVKAALGDGVVAC